ncbi:MAG: translation initiation factor IF-6 [Candidatus Altiarchaeota archaeon]
MHYQQLSVQGEDFIGLLGLATDRYAVLARKFPDTDVLGVESLRTRIYATNLVGMFCAGNSNGLLVPYFVGEDEMQRLREFLNPMGVEVGKIEDIHTALGNMIACNDKGCVLSPKILDYHVVEEVLGVEAVSMSLGGLEEVGACVCATNKGFIASPYAEGQLKALSDVLKVGGDVGTVNFGVSFVKSGLIANSNGYMTGSRTSGIEVGEIESALGFI